MEDFQLDILIGKGPTARSIRLDLPRFTLVGATARPGFSRAPSATVSGSSGAWTCTPRKTCRGSWRARPGSSASRWSSRVRARIASRARGTPRIANRLLRRVRDFVEVRAQGAITASLALEGLELFGVDELGLDKVDRAILDALCRRFDGRPVGLVTLAHCVGEEPTP